MAALSYSMGTHLFQKVRVLVFKIIIEMKTVFRVSNLLAFLGHTGRRRRVILGYILNTL